MIFKTFIFLLLTGLALPQIFCRIAFAQSLPSTKEFQDLLTTCAMGSKIDISADIIGSVASIYSGERTKGIATLKSETKFIEFFPPQDRLKATELYHKCIQEFLKNHTSMPNIPKEPEKPKIVTALYQTGILIISVSHPPSGDPFVLVNNKDISAQLNSELAASESRTYQFNGSPDQINVSVGKNKIVVKYGNIILPEFYFKYTEMQQKEDQRLHQLQQLQQLQLQQLQQQPKGSLPDRQLLQRQLQLLQQQFKEVPTAR